MNVLASMIAVSVPPADAAGLGKIEMKAMRDTSYDETLLLRLRRPPVIGPIIPPGIIVVIYATKQTYR